MHRKNRTASLAGEIVSDLKRTVMLQRVLLLALAILVIRKGGSVESENRIHSNRL